MKKIKKAKNKFLQECITLPKGVIDKFLKSERPSDLISLYVFYNYTAKWQKTNQVWAVTGFAAKGLSLTVARVRRAKAELIKFGLIKDVKRKDKKTKKITGWYIKINYIPSLSKIHRVENDETNASSIDSKNASNINNNIVADTTKQNSPPDKPNYQYSYLKKDELEEKIRIINQIPIEVIICNYMASIGKPVKFDGRRSFHGQEDMLNSFHKAYSVERNEENYYSEKTIYNLAKDNYIIRNNSKSLSSKYKGYNPFTFIKTHYNLSTLATIKWFENNYPECL